MNDSMPAMKKLSAETGYGGALSGASKTPIGDGVACSRKHLKSAKAGGGYVLEACFLGA